MVNGQGDTWEYASLDRLGKHPKKDGLVPVSHGRPAVASKKLMILIQGTESLWVPIVNLDLRNIADPKSVIGGDLLIPEGKELIFKKSKWSYLPIESSNLSRETNTTHVLHICSKGSSLGHVVQKIKQGNPCANNFHFTKSIPRPMLNNEIGAIMKL